MYFTHGTFYGIISASTCLAEKILLAPKAILRILFSLVFLEVEMQADLAMKHQKYHVLPQKQRDEIVIQLGTSLTFPAQNQPVDQVKETVWEGVAAYI